MANPPELLPTNVSDGQAPGIRYRIQGELVPVLHLWLDGQVPVYFEHHIVLWKDTSLEIGVRPGISFKRMLAGMQLFLTEARGPGEIAFSRDDPGHVFPLHLAAGQSVIVREHQYVAATGNVDYNYIRLKGIANMLYGNSGIFLDRFSAKNHEGVIWVHGYGNVFEKALGPGEQIDVEPGGWVYYEESVQMNQTIFGLKTGIFGGAGRLIWNRFTGPGRIGIQSGYIHLPTAE